MKQLQHLFFDEILGYRNMNNVNVNISYIKNGLLRVNSKKILIMLRELFNLGMSIALS